MLRIGLYAKQPLKIKRVLNFYMRYTAVLNRTWYAVQPWQRLPLLKKLGRLGRQDQQIPSSFGRQCKEGCSLFELQFGALTTTKPFR